MMPLARNISRWLLHPVFLSATSLFWLVWFFVGSQLFSWTYTPLPKKIAITVVALLLPVTMLTRPSWICRIVAVLLIALTWYFIVFMWLYDKKPYGL